MTPAERDEHRREWIEERAGVLEFEASYPRAVAEVMARVQWADYEKARAQAMQETA
jgi:hypothetical protein